MAYPSDINAKGPLASRPAAAPQLAGVRYWDTDSNTIARCNGTTWDDEPAGTSTGDAADVTFDATGLANTSATDVQAAIEDLDAALAAVSVPGVDNSTIEISSGNLRVKDAGIVTAKIADESVTSAKLANMAQATVKGRASGAGTGAPSDLTAAQLAAIIDAVAHAFAENASFDKAKRIKVVTLTDAATVAMDASAGDAFYLSTANSRAFGIPSNAPATGYSQVITVTVKNTSGGSITPTLTTSGSGCWRYGTTVTALPAIAAGKSMAFTARWHQADSVWDVLGTSNGF